MWFLSWQHCYTQKSNLSVRADFCLLFYIISIFILSTAYSVYIVTMNRLLVEERLRIVQTNFENRSSILATYRVLSQIYEHHSRSS